ncbi:polysaccharide biosynthesis/export family protein [Dyadobacter sp. Leaf189]|uniref:polysaccharide biosynthesis/export family protein n=1 Tax=Dyadobacter sp. Leaf189 TaxID=1736295 RepID=UPI0006FDE0E2|nr:polysaccharide biosynthesis/export family protein [Dyadobacter sp. Leaf189]KQS31509.1 sugar transporter [Dyadobacter sp. Leaf189]
MKNLQSWLAAVLLMLFFASCSSYKNVPYFKDLNQALPSVDTVANYTSLTVQTDDILGINVTSLNPEASVIFNYNLGRVNGNNFDNSNGNPVLGYLVDKDGNIQLPLIGSFKVAGLTTAQVRENMTKRLTTYLREPVVNIRLLNFRISVLGDVLRPDNYNVQKERITVIEAISMAGDLNITANRTNIVLIRERDGKREYYPIDLTSKKVFDQPFYYLKNNDIIYVKPERTKFAAVDRSYRTASLVLSALSIIAIVITQL